MGIAKRPREAKHIINLLQSPCAFFKFFCVLSENERRTRSLWQCLLCSLSLSSNSNRYEDKKPLPLISLFVQFKVVVEGWKFSLWEPEHRYEHERLFPAVSQPSPTGQDLYQRALPHKGSNNSGVKQRLIVQKIESHKKSPKRIPSRNPAHKKYYKGWSGSFF